MANDKPVQSLFWLQKSEKIKQMAEICKTRQNSKLYI